MAPSETSIANAALAHLGERRITDLADPNSRTAKLLQDRFDDVRDALLRRHDWNFASTRASLSLNATAPTWGFANAYNLPTDMLRMIEVRDAEHDEYRIEAGQIVTDHGPPLYIRYTARVTDAQQMDVLFRESLAALLAAETAEAITGDRAKVGDLLQIVDEKIRYARNADGQEDPPRSLIASEWLDSREETGPVRRIPTGTGTPL